MVSGASPVIAGTANDNALPSPLWRLTVTVVPWSTTNTGPGAVAGPAPVDANPQIGTGPGAPGNTTVPVNAHSSHVAANVPVTVQPVCGNGPCAGANAGTCAACAAGAVSGAAGGGACGVVAGGAACAATGVASTSAIAMGAANPRQMPEKLFIARPFRVTGPGTRWAGRYG